MNAPAHTVAADRPDAAPGWLRGLLHWPRDLLAMLDTEAAVVRVLVAGRRGSAPREAGATMLVGAQEQRGTIGGGHLEYTALAAARRLLDPSAPAARLQRYVLGRELGQCCGGVVELWIERYTAADHDALQALANAASGSRLRSELVDGRLQRRLLPPVTASSATTSANTAPDLGPPQAVPSPAGGRGWRAAPGEGLFPASAPLSDAPPSLPAAGLSPARGREDGSARARLHEEGGGHAPEPLRVTCANDRLVIDEPLPAPHPPVWLFGAGHVGQALAKLLAELPLQLTWIDPRREFMPADRPATIEVCTPADPVALVAQAPAATRYVVMTHDHALDYALCRAVLARGDFAFAGLIGSDSKAARFRSRLAREDGFEAALIARLACPIGIEGIHSKWPAAIAVAVAAQLLRSAPEAATPAVSTRASTTASASASLVATTVTASTADRMTASLLLVPIDEAPAHHAANLADRPADTAAHFLPLPHAESAADSFQDSAGSPGCTESRCSTCQQTPHRPR